MNQQQSILGVEKDGNGNTLVKVFISYKRNDNLFNHLQDIVDRTMDKLNNDLLKDSEYRVEKVIDLNSISLGDKWKKKIDKDLSNSDILLAFITEAYLTSDPCRYEFNTFSMNQIDNRIDSEEHHESLCVPVFWADQKTGSLLSGKADKQATQSDILPKPQPVYLQDNAPPNRYGNMKVW